MGQHKSIYQLQLAFVSLVERLIETLADERGIDISHGMSGALRQSLLREVDTLCDEWFSRIQNNQPIAPSSKVEQLLVEIYGLDAEIFDCIDEERPGTLH
jgi:hypothetical protein